MDKISRSVMEAARARVLKYIRRSRIALVHTDMNLTQAAAILSAHNAGIAAVVDEPEKPHLCYRCKHYANQTIRGIHPAVKDKHWEIECRISKTQVHHHVGFGDDGWKHIMDCSSFEDRE